jgi:hypothetical protein
MYDGFLSFGGNEIINAERSRGISESLLEPITWMKGSRAPSLGPALGDAAYTLLNITKAPWYSAADDLSSRFYGVFPISITGIPDSTRTAAVLESVGDGGVVGTTRKSTKTVRVRALLSAAGGDALDFGMAWLSAALDPGACGQHGVQCGSADLQFFSAIPPSLGDYPDSPTWLAAVNNSIRYMHSATAISGPFVIDRLKGKADHTWGYIVEFSFQIAAPWTFTLARNIALTPGFPTTIQDIPYNLVPYPSAELTTNVNVEMGRNYATNPSSEVDSSSWGTQVRINSGADATPYFTGGQSNDISVVGTFSERARILGNLSTAATGSALSIISQGGPLGGAVLPGARFSVSMWVAMFITSGSGAGTSLTSMEVFVQWTIGGASAGAPVSLGSTTTPSDFSGKVFSAAGMTPGANADGFFVYANFVTTWTSSATASNNSDIRMYADALVVTNA